MKDVAGNELAVDDIVVFVGKRGAGMKRGMKLRIRAFSEIQRETRCLADDAIAINKRITEHDDWTVSAWLKSTEIVRTK